jgi:hypothetical protein
MAISFPLSLPAGNTVRSVEMSMLNAVAASRSPFTFSEQIHKWPGEAWAATITLKPMRRPDAEAWIAFLASLRGAYGTFLLGDPYGCQARGSATSATITGAAGAETVSVTMSGTLLAGDYLQLGSGSDATLHKVLKDKSGSGSLEIWPALRKSRSGVSAVLTNPRGLFRLASNETGWTANELSLYGVSFPAIEAVS